MLLFIITGFRGKHHQISEPIDDAATILQGEGKFFKEDRAKASGRNVEGLTLRVDARMH
jgi:hypothetical protein